MNTLKNLFLPIIIASLTIAFLSCNSQREKPGVYENQILNADAPPETEILGQLAGTWDAAQSIMNKDGTWGDSKHSKWKWYYMLDGHAIQDDWITLDSLNNEQVVGTNIRIYNSKEDQWHVAWIDKTHRRLASFTAVNDNGTVIMDGTNANGRQIKNTFFNITENEFDWKQEWTFDEGQSWVVVAKIHNTRIN